jgi:hypothetical protein
MDRTEKELEIIQTYLNFVNRLDESYDSSKLEHEFKSV